MSTAKLVKWGNSIGIRIPAQDLKLANAHLGEEFEIAVNDKGGFTLNPTKNPQQGWLDAFNQAADANNDNLLIDQVNSQFDQDEWTW